MPLLRSLLKHFSSTAAGCRLLCTTAAGHSCPARSKQEFSRLTEESLVFCKTASEGINSLLINDIWIAPLHFKAPPLFLPFQCASR